MKSRKEEQLHLKTKMIYLKFMFFLDLENFPNCFFFVTPTYILLVFSIHSYFISIV